MIINSPVWTSGLARWGIHSWIKFLKSGHCKVSRPPWGGTPGARYRLRGGPRPTGHPLKGDGLLTDPDAIGHFDPSRIPTRFAFQVPQARLSIEQDIADLSKSNDGNPPALIHVALGDPKYRHMAGIPRSLVAKG